MATTATTLAGTFSPATAVLTGVRRPSRPWRRGAAILALALALGWLTILIPGLARMPAVVGEPQRLSAPVVATAMASGSSFEAPTPLPGPHPDR